MMSRDVELTALQATLFDTAGIMYGLLATARAVQKKENAVIGKEQNVFLECLLEELEGNEKRTIQTFEDALARVWSKLKPRFKLVGTPEALKAIYNKTLDALRKMRDDGLDNTFKEIFPLRLMLCWLDALDMIIEACEIIGKKMGSSQYKSRRIGRGVQDEIYSVAIGADILLIRIAEQTRKYNRNKETGQIPEDELIDTFIELLAHDMAYLIEIQGANNLLANPEKDSLSPEKKDFAAFQEFLIKNYGEST